MKMLLNDICSSKSRTKVLEFIAKNPDRRFYLRGLEKELGCPATPLRRELIRLEKAGFLKSYQEANLKYYYADKTHPYYEKILNLTSSQSELFTPQPNLLPTGEKEWMRGIREGGEGLKVRARYIAGLLCIFVTIAMAMYLTHFGSVKIRTPEVRREVQYEVPSARMESNSYQMQSGSFGIFAPAGEGRFKDGAL